MLASLATILLTNTSNAEVNLDKKCYSVDERNKIALYLTEHDICKRDLAACQLSVEDMREPEVDHSSTVVAAISGIILGALVTSMIKK